MLFRAVIAGLFALLAGVQVVRTGSVAALAEQDVATIAPYWPGHPEVLRSVAMAHVGAAAGRGAEPPPAAMERLRRLLAAEPLALEPFLVRAALAQRRWQFEPAEALLLQARRRDPRSEAARFLLADQYIRSGQVLAGLAEMSVLGRLVPGAREQVAPALAAYGESAGSVPHLKRILIAYPELEAPLLGQLAQDPANAELILAIAEPLHFDEPAPLWPERLVSGLVEKGAYQRAYRIWARLAGVPANNRGTLFNPAFGASKAPPPFNWSLGSSSGGVAEPDSGGLRVIYYGRDDVALASQAVLLAPGRYRLSMTLSGQVADEAGIGWRVSCLPEDHVVFDLPLGGKAGGAVGGDFTIPAGCAAQRIALRGEAQEFPQSADFRIGNLQLARTGG